MDSFAVVRSTTLHIPLPQFHPSHFIAIWQRPCPIQISLKVSERDKHKMHEAYQPAWDKQGEDNKTCWDDLDPSEKLPPLKYSETDADGWEDLDVPVLYFFGGLIPYASQYVSSPTPVDNVLFRYSHSSRDLLQWPLALPGDGLIDVAVQEVTSLSTLIGQMDVAPQGGQYWAETVSKGRLSN